MSLFPLPDGGRLAYSVDGAGPPLLLLRPLGGSAALWGAFHERLLQRFCVVAFDPRGVGASSAAPLLTTTRGMARDARALLDHLALGPLHLFGLSLGGMVASWLALDLQASGRLRRLVLASTVARGLDISLRGLLRGLQLARCLLRPCPDAELCLVRRVLSPRFRAERPAEVARILATVRAHASRHSDLRRLVLALATHDAHRQLPRLLADTLVLAGEIDGLVDHRAQRRVQGQIPGARFDVIASAGHDLTLERPRETAVRVADFLMGPPPR